MKRFSKVAVSTIGVTGLSFAAMMCCPSSTEAMILPGIDPQMIANGVGTAANMVTGIGNAVAPFDKGITSTVGNTMSSILGMVMNPATIGPNVMGIIQNIMNTAMGLFR